MSIKNNTTSLQSLLEAVNALPEAGGEQATPVISVNSTNGLITATAGTKSSTYQLAFQPAKTITPSTASQIAVSGGYYTGGNITVAGDSNLIADNIKSGISIFGVTGSYESSGEQAEWSANEDSIVSGMIQEYTNDRVTEVRDYAFFAYNKLISINFPEVTSIGSYAFQNCINLTSVSFPWVTSIRVGTFSGCSKLTSVSFPKARSIDTYAFRDCDGLTTVNFPKVNTVGNTAFSSCSKLTSVSFPEVTTILGFAFAHCINLTTVSFPWVMSISYNAFWNCINLTTVSFPEAKSIGYDTFTNCYNLKSLYLTGSSLCTLVHSNAFYSTPIGGYSTSAGTYGSIYVPASLLTSYQTATNWTYFSSRFVAFDGGNNIITFTIAGIEYQAEEGMTWGEWTESKYNSSGYIIKDNCIMLTNGQMYIIICYDSINVKDSELIIHNREYTTIDNEGIEK